MPVVVPVPVPVVPPVVVPEHIAFAFARDDAPQYPVPAVRPTGVKMSAAYAFWNLMTAAFVAGPKVLVSLPAEPAPEAATVKPLLLRNFWSAITSAPVEPCLRF